MILTKHHIEGLITRVQLSEVLYYLGICVASKMYPLSGKKQKQVKLKLLWRFLQKLK